MQISVTGQKIDVGDALRSYVETQLSTSVSKFFGNPIEANVVFSRDAHLFCAEVSIHVGRGIQVQGRDEADAPYPAFDLALDHAVQQLRRRKEKLRDHDRRDTGTRGNTESL